MSDYKVMIRQSRYWREKVFNYYVPLRGEVIVEPVFIYAPYIPLFKVVNYA